jgi:hypothetical protein
VAEKGEMLASPCEGRRRKLSRGKVPARSIEDLDIADDKRRELMIDTNAQRDEAAKKKRKSSKLSTNKGSRSKVKSLCCACFPFADCASFC